MEKSTGNKGPKKLLDPHATKSYLKYSGMAFQMAAYVVVGLLLGKQIDRYFQTEKPVFTALLILLFLAAFFIKLIADVRKGEF